MLNIKVAAWVKAIFFVFLFGFSALASTEKFSKQWSSKCRFSGKDLAISAQSKSGDPYEDDMTAKLKIGKRELIVPIGSGLFFPVAPAKGSLSDCDKTAGYALDDGKALIFFGNDNRPGLASLIVLLIDTKSGNILDLISDMNPFITWKERQIQFKKTPEGIRVLLVQGSDKKSISDGPEKFLDGWAKFSAVESSLRAVWEKKLPETHEEFLTKRISSP